MLGALVLFDQRPEFEKERLVGDSGWILGMLCASLTKETGVKTIDRIPNTLAKLCQVCSCVL